MSRSRSKGHRKDCLRKKRANGGFSFLKQAVDRVPSRQVCGWLHSKYPCFFACPFGHRPEAQNTPRQNSGCCLCEPRSSVFVRLLSFPFSPYINVFLGVFATRPLKKTYSAQKARKKDTEKHNGACDRKGCSRAFDTDRGKVDGDDVDHCIRGCKNDRCAKSCKAVSPDFFQKFNKGCRRGTPRKGTGEEKRQKLCGNADRPCDWGEQMRE